MIPILLATLLVVSNESLRSGIEDVFANLSAIVADNLNMPQLVCSVACLSTVVVFSGEILFNGKILMNEMKTIMIGFLLGLTSLAFLTEIQSNLNKLVHHETFQYINNLKFLEPTWQLMLDNFSSFTIVSIFTFILHEVAYFVFWIPYIIIDQIPYFRKYKIQQNKPNTWAQTWKCLKHLMFNHVFIQFPMILGSDFGLRQLGFRMDLPLPQLTTVIWKCGLMFVIEDFYFYWVHRLLHWKKIYKYVHKWHHDFAAPFGIAAEYAHPVETLILGIGTIMGPFFLTRHLFTLWVWLLVRLLETVDDHSGYDIPFHPSNFLPLWGGAVHHDFHHKTFEGNYASVFTIWDRVFGTDRAFRIYQNEKRRKHDSGWSDIFDKTGLAPVSTTIKNKKTL